MRRFTRVRDQSISGSVTGPSDANWQRALEPALDHPAHTCLDSVPTGGRCLRCPIRTLTGTLRRSACHVVDRLSMKDCP